MHFYISRVYPSLLFFSLRAQRRRALSVVTYFKGKCKTVLSKIFCCSGRNISMAPVRAHRAHFSRARRIRETSRVAGCNATFSRAHQDRCNKPLAPVTGDRLFHGAELRASCHDGGSLIRGKNAVTTRNQCYLFYGMSALIYIDCFFPIPFSFLKNRNFAFEESYLSYFSIVFTYMQQ